MMHKIIIFLALFMTAAQVEAQIDQLKVESVKAFLEKIDYRTDVSITYRLLKENFLEDRSWFFATYQVEEDSANVARYDAIIVGDLELFEAQALRRLELAYERVSSDSLKVYMTFVQKGNVSNQAYERTRYDEFLTEIVSSHLDDLKKDFDLIAMNIKAKNEPLKLNVKIDGVVKEYTSNPPIDLLLTTTNPKYPEVDIYDNKTGFIELPKDLKYEEIEEIFVQFKKRKILMERNVMARMLRKTNPELAKTFESNDLITPYCFDSLLHWDLDINIKNTELLTVTLKTRVGVTSSVKTD